MKKRNGFTLIELLAVLVILAVIALIAVPKIIEILNKAKRSAAEYSTMGIVEATKIYVASFMLQNQGAIPENLEFECNNNGCNLKTNIDGYNKENLEELKFKGKKTTSGTITVSDSGKNIIVNNLKISGFTCIYDGESSTCGDYKDRVVLSEEFEDKGIKEGYEGLKAIVYLDPTDLTKECNADKLVPITETGPNEGCMKWYAYKDEDGKYTMIADHNISNNVVWNSNGNNYEGPSEVLETLREATAETVTYSDKLVSPESYTASWEDKNGVNQSYTIDYSKYGNKARLISAEEIADITGASKSVDDGGIGWNRSSISADWFYLDGKGDSWHEQVGNSIQKSKYAWLFDNTVECIKYGCNVEQYKDWGYWTVSPYTSDVDRAWNIVREGSLTTHKIVTGYGLRPVITVKKADLLQ